MAFYFARVNVIFPNFGLGFLLCGTTEGFALLLFRYVRTFFNRERRNSEREIQREGGRDRHKEAPSNHLVVTINKGLICLYGCHTQLVVSLHGLHREYLRISSNMILTGMKRERLNVIFIF